jgi:hypothetical protein
MRLRCLLAASLVIVESIVALAFLTAAGDTPGVRIVGPVDTEVQLGPREVLELSTPV